MNDVRRNEMMRADLLGGLNDAYNAPLVISIRHDSVYKFFRALPADIKPPADLPRQINAESLISAEIQRVFSAFLIMWDRLNVDDQVEGYTPKAIFRWAVESTESNHFAKKILDLCLGDNEASRLNVNVIRAHRDRNMFDEFEAIYFNQYAAVVDANPEYFGFTYNVLKRREDLVAMNEQEYNDRRRTGIIMDNALLLDAETHVHRLRWDELNVMLRSYALITELRRRDVATLLPNPIMYREELVTTLKDDNPAPFVVGNVDNEEIHVISRETLTTNTFALKVLLPSSQTVFRPDQIFYGSDFLQFWSVSHRRLTRSLNVQEIIGEWMRLRVRTWKGYVRFVNPLSLEGLGD